LRDTGHSFEVDAQGEVDLETLRQSGTDSGYKYLVLPKEGPAPPEIAEAQILDYGAQKEKEQRVREARNNAKNLSAEELERLQSDGPVREWPLYKALNVLQGDGVTNRMMLTIAQLGETKWAETQTGAIAALAEGRRADSKLEVGMVQVFNPHSAKGYARLKPDSTGRGDKTKDAWAEPFLEYLRYRGLFESSSVFFLGQKGEHVRLIAPEPRDISGAVFHDVAGQLRRLRIGGSGAKVDCVATLEVARLLIDRSAQFGSSWLPCNVITGIVITHYQSMGQAKSVTSLSRLALPGWFPVQSEADQERWRAVLAEHRTALVRLKDEISEELGLLMQYRRFLEQRGEKAYYAFAEFLEGYGCHLVRKRGEGKWQLRQFREDYLEVVMSASSYTEILNNAGFRAVANALRSATVSAQSRKKNKLDHREIRYDVLPELRRKRSLPGKDPFLEAVSSFIDQYNAESARRLEMGKETGRSRVSTEDFAEFAKLLDGRKDASVVGALLCAYATCKKPKDEEDAAPAEEAIGQEGGEE
jgi:hypothetical protein